MTDLDALAQRAYAAADARGIATHDLRLAEEHLELDSGGWRGELLEVVRAAWGDAVLFARHRRWDHDEKGP